MNIWQKAFADPIPWNDILIGMAYLGGTSLASVLAAWGIFVRNSAFPRSS
jgi:hypothetical protein